MTGREARSAVAALERAGAVLRERSVDSVAEILAGVCGRFADREDPVRADAEVALAAHHGAPLEAIARVLDAGFAGRDVASIRGWVDGELGRRDALDDWVELAGTRRRARGPRLALAIEARGVPTVPVVDLMAALLVKAPVWLKPAGGADDLAERFAAALDAADPELGAAVRVARWEPGSEAARVVMAAADLVSATGGASTMEAIRREVGERVRVVLHGPRLSVAAIGAEALSADRGAAIADLADDVAFAGQAGCLSPVVAWVEAAVAEVDALVEPVFEALAARWPGRPRSDAPAGERAVWAEWTALAAVEASAGTSGPTAGGATAGWTVRSRASAGPPEPPPVPRALVLEPVASLEEIAGLCAARRGAVAAAGLRADRGRVARLAGELAEAGVERVTPLGRMQRPPLSWRRDGRTEIGDLVRWTDWETEAG